MSAEIRKCTGCGRYTLLHKCQTCGIDTIVPVPARYSPDDRMGEYRRRSIIKEYGENGKPHNL